MHEEVETIREMSETLESANFGRDQSDAFIQSVALAMKTFAVTPKVLDDRLGELRREWKQDFGEFKKETNQRLDSMDRRLDQQQGTLDELKDTMHSLQRTLLGYLLGFTLVIGAGLLGTLGALLPP